MIGQGAFSKVYRMTEQVTGEQVACKISEHIAMLKAEWELLCSLEHPLIPGVYEWREEGGYGFLFLEYVPGNNLEEYIRKNGKLSGRKAIGLGKVLAEGLCYLHEQKYSIIFRDLKPANIMLGEDGSVKLLDFGSAVRLQDIGTDISGTRGYAAPEQWIDWEKIGCHSDVYALGKVLVFAMNPVWARRWFRRLLKDCTRERVEERIPNMRCFLTVLKRKGRGYRKKQGELLYQQSVLRL